MAAEGIATRPKNNLLFASPAAVLEEAGHVSSWFLFSSIIRRFSFLL